MRLISRLTPVVLATVGVLAGSLMFSAAPAFAGTGYGLSFSFAPAGGFNGSVGLAVDNSADSSKGDVYVVEQNNNVLVKYNAKGELQEGFGSNGHVEMAGATPNQAVVDDFAGADQGDVFVAGYGNGVVYRINAAGTEVTEAITGLGNPTGVAVDGAGDFFVSLISNGTVVEFNGKWEPINTAGTVVNEGENTVVEGLNGPQTLAVDSTGENIYVATGSGAVQATLLAGSYISSTLDGNGANGVTVAPSGDVFVDQGGEVAEYEPSGTRLLTFGAGVLSGSAYGVGVSSKYVYVADYGAGRVDAFEEGSTPESPETLPAGEVKAESAVYHGKLKLAAGETKLKYYFEYNTGSGCAGGTRTPTQEGTGEVTEPVEGLVPSASYEVCLVAENKFGPTLGNAVPFTTEAVAATVQGLGTSGVTPFAATLEAQVNAENEPTTCEFEYGTTQGVYGPPVACEQGATLEGYPAQRASLNLTGLTPSEKYFYRLVVKNATGKAEAAGEFTTATPEKPRIEGEGVSELTSSGAKLEATVNPDFQETTCEFEYGTQPALTAGTTTTTPCEAPLGNGGSGVGTAVTVTGLEAGTTYFYRVVAENATPPASDGAIESFTTQSTPLVTTGEAQTITQNTATFTGTVNPTGLETTYYFQYIDQAGYEKALAGNATEKADPYAEGETTTPLSSSSDEAVAVGPSLASGLLPETTYHYALVAKNLLGERYGEDHTFTTGGKVLPGVSTGGASGVSQNSATLSGTVSTNGLQTNYGFEIGTEPGNYGPATGLGSIGGAATEEVHVTLGELQPGTTYYYRVEASNADGTVQGAPQSFTTPGFPTLISPPASPPQIATPNIAFPTETANTQPPTIEVISHKVRGKTATIKVSVPSAGKLVATGRGVSKGTAKASRAGDVTVKVSLTKHERALLEKHRGRKLKVNVKLAFTSTSGSQLTTSTTVLLG